MENCSGKPGVVYDFNKQCLISYQDNFHTKGDGPFAVYFDFETTAHTDNCLDPEQKKMFVDRIIVYRSFAHSIEQLTALDYFSREQITFIEPHLINMLKIWPLKFLKESVKTV